MGNIGYSQGLAPLVAAFERSDALEGTPVRFIITGNGMAAEDTRSEIRSDRVEMPGVVDDDRLEEELQAATIAFVSQQHEGAEFNIPSKIMNFMAYGLPVLAAVNPSGEVARIVERADAGWVVDSSDPDSFPRKLAEILRCSGGDHGTGTRRLPVRSGTLYSGGLCRAFRRLAHRSRWTLTVSQAPRLRKQRALYLVGLSAEA